MPHLRIHRPDDSPIEENPMRFPTEWFDDAEREPLSLADQMVELAQDERDLIGTIKRMQSETRTLEESLAEALHLVGNDHDEPPAAA
jgi:hypothetical protein